MQPYNFALCVNDKYSRYIAVTVKSICENHRDNPVAIHILTDYISTKNQHRLKDIVSAYQNAEIYIYAVDDSQLKGLKDTWSIYTWYRVLVPQLLPGVSRCLYLDADTVVTDDLSELFTMPMEGKSIACAIDSENFKDETRQRCEYGEADIYVCAGVMMMNLDYWREHNLTEQIVRWGYENDARIKFPDQDTINILCNRSKIVMPVRYGVQHIFYYNPNFLGGLREQLVEAYHSPAIIHYAGYAPWVAENTDTLFHPYWEKYNSMLPRRIKAAYKTRGINGLKVRLWRLLHPYDNRLDRQRTEKALQLR